MENKFNSQMELFRRLKPALRTKRHEMMREGIKIVKDIDIWNYNKQFNWRNAKGLTISSMVDNILNTNASAYEEYVINKINKN